MNISLKNIDAASGILKLEIVKADYAAQLEKSLRGFRQKANVPGFRKGMVPMSLVKKMYGNHVLIEEVNKLVSDALFNYIRENDLKILGEPMPNESEQKEIDFATQEDFEFCFDLALAPEITVELTKKDTLLYYQVAIDDEMLNKQIDSYRANFGSYEQTEDVVEKDLIKGVVAELENGVPKQGGILVEDAVLMPMYLKDEDEKAKFLAAKKHEVVVFNPHKGYEGAAGEIAAFLQIDKEAVANTTGDFSFEIKEITRYKEAPLNQELFDKVFGEGVVANEEQFKEKVKASLAEQFHPQSDYKFLLDARAVLVDKAGTIAFSETILKRWLLVSNEKNTKETIDEEYPTIVNDLTYHLIKESLVKKNDIKIENEDLDLFSKRVAKAQFAQYGMLSVPADVLDNYAKEMLKNKQTLQNVIDRAVEDKLAAWLKAHVTLEIKEVSAAEFDTLFQE